MRDLRFIENDAVLELAGVAHDDAVSDDDILAHVAAAADLAIFAYPCWAFQDSALLDNCAASDENVGADEGPPYQIAKHTRLQPKLQIARDLFERVPNKLFVLEQFLVRSVFEIEELCGRKHFYFAPARRVIFCPSFV